MNVRDSLQKDHRLGYCIALCSLVLLYPTNGRSVNIQLYNQGFVCVKYDEWFAPRDNLAPKCARKGASNGKRVGKGPLLPRVK